MLSHGGPQRLIRYRWIQQQPGAHLSICVIDQDEPLIPLNRRHRRFGCRGDDKITQGSTTQPGGTLDQLLG